MVRHPLSPPKPAGLVKLPNHTSRAGPSTGGATVQPFTWARAGAAALLMGGAYWLWRQATDFSDLGDAAAEGLGEGLESIDHYLYSRDGFYQNSHAGAQFASEWQRFQAAGAAASNGIICYQDNANAFRQRVLNGVGFIWVLTEEGRLVVGNSSFSVNHSILARGSAVIGAGEGRLRLTRDESLWQEYQHATHLYQIGGYDADAEGEERYHELAGMNLTAPQQRRTGTVVLDFSSGHYRPRSGWRRVLDAWGATGLHAVVDEDSNRR